MKVPMESLLPNRKGFEVDPIGYSALAWHKWGLAQTFAGFDVDITKPPTAEDLKSPVLWLTHATAMSECARIVIQNEPNIDHLPIYTKGVCHTQYFAVGLMLVGYSLEICLKAMLIIKNGVEQYSSNERDYHHHKLVELAKFIPNLSDKDKAILQALTHFTTWAGRYPDPGSKRINDATDIFSLAETYQITAKDLFELSARVMDYTKQVVQ